MMHRCRCLFFSGLLALASLAAAQTPSGELEPLEDELPGGFDTESIESQLDTEDNFFLEGFGDALAYEAFQAIDAGQYVKARELTERILAADPQSGAGHVLLGMVLHRGEGNLPRALFILKQGRKLIEGSPVEGGDAELQQFWRFAVINELSLVTGSMGRHSEKLAYLALRDELFAPRWPADRGWPLMRLRRYDEARQAAMEGLLVDDPDQVATARNTLCAIEAELLDRDAAYRECLAAAEADREALRAGPTQLTNAAEAALGLLKMDEAERLILEATDHFLVGTVSNPWLDLTHLYLSEGRIAEALDAIRRMFAWRNRQPAYVDEQNRAETDMASALFLLVAGHAQEAARITTRSLERPDRTGFTSAESEQLEAAAALLDSVAYRTMAEQLDELASWSSFWDALAVRWQAVQHRLRAWSSGRRAAALLAAGERILLTTLRPYLAGSIDVPEWIEPELCAILGPGVVAAAVGEARRQETLAGAEGYFRAFEAEIAFLQGRSGEALRRVEEALAALPASEVLLRARVAVVGAQTALDDGDRARAVKLFELALQLDPGAVRRQGAALPASFVAAPNANAVAMQALRHLRRSPRFVAGEGGFVVRVEDSGAACLVGPQGTVLSCAQITPRAGDDAEAMARRLAQEFHAEVFAPRVDLTQADIRSLDGSPTAAGGGRSAERLRLVLDDVADEAGR